jgi:hypothetical protein
MAAEIVQIDTQNFTSQTYGGQDTNLISTFEVNTSLSSSSYIEYFVYDNNQNLLSTDYNFTQYTVLADGQSAGLNNTISQIIIDPEKSLINSGFDQGEYVTYFNFFNKQIGSELQQLYIVEISSDRTEIRLDSTSLTDLDIVEQANSLIQQREDSSYFLDFYLNFGDNQLAIANNIQLDNQDPTNPTILIKLYEALPEEFDVNSTLWVVTLVEEPIAYQVIFPLEPIEILDTVNLKGPNFNLELKDQINNSTVSLDYTALTTTSLTSSYNQLSSLLEEKEIDINIDYTDFNEFIHFSSVEARLENFYYKMSLLEDYSSSIAVLNTTTNNDPSASLTVYESLINNIITNFDGYEYYLYYNSGSWAWPKTTSQPPYQLASTGSVVVDTWYDNIILSASNFDNTNQNNLYYSIPEYLRDDSLNTPYQMFVEMMGQFYDNIWIYYKDVTQKYNADNRLEYGVSKDIVADAIRDFGIKLYQNNFSNDDLYTAFLGLTPQGGLFPFPNITGSLPTPSGFEYINTLISASNDYMPLDDVNKSLYKRIYHNLPYLLKAKGTLPGLRTLITSYGIPGTVLRINEFGGKDKSNSNDWDDWQNVFNYAFFTSGSNKITTDWTLNPSWNSADNVPASLEFRFKLPDLAIISGSLYADLFRTDGDSRLQLRYTGSGLTTASYSGSIIDPYYQYTHLDFYPDLQNFPNSSASIYLPFANEGWWSVMVTRTGSNFTLYAGNNVYEGGENGTQLGFYTTSSVNEDSTGWSTSTTVDFMPQQGEMYLQEIRYYNTVLSESVFKDYIMNPSSTEGNSLNSSPDQLAFRLSLGGELYTGSRSIHPKVTGSWTATSSFVGYSSASFTSTPVFVPNTEYFFLDQPVVGIKNAVSDKIRIENSVIPSGDTLSPFRSLAQNTAASQSYTANTNLLEVAFAPQDEINDDIISQIGYFNIGEFIGDPRQRFTSATSYPDLDALRNEYFEKYTSNYDLNDYIRLIKYFDNSLFKMIKDFVPARTSLASGVVIKQTLLERNKYPQPQVDINSTIAYTTSGSQNNIPFTFQNIEVSGTVAPQWNDYQPGTIENFSGGAGGTMNMFNDPSFNYPPSIILDIFEQDLYLTSEILPISASATLTIVGNFFNETGDNPTECEIAYIPPTGPNESLFYSNIPGSTTEYFNITIPVQVGGQLLFTGFSSLDGVFLTTTVTSYPTPTNLYNLNQSWYETFTTPSGSVTVLHSSQDEFYDGEFSGSVLVVTTQSLAQPYPLENLSFDYTPVRYSPQNYGFGSDSLFGQQQFLAPVTVPNQGEILLLRPWRNLVTNNTGPSLVKIHKIDNNGVDNTTPLGQISQLLIKYSTFSSYSTMNVLTINEYPTYYLYEVSSLGSNTVDDYIKDYRISGSITNSQTLFSGNDYALKYTASINPISLYNQTSGFITYTQTPNIRLDFTASLTGQSTSGTTSVILSVWDQSQTFLYSTSPATRTLTGSLYLLANSAVSAQATIGANNFTLSNFQFNITPYVVSSSAENDPIIIEPYITTPNYYNSDYNPLINNTEGDRLSSKFQDVDYSTGMVTPTNFDLLISGSALKAAVQDSNYTSKRVTLPRYDGSKSTSQHLNYWTPGDAGTYGKLPTVESLKTMVAYCDWIGGWPPERENASAIHVQYLIKSDGTVIIPNTSENSLADIKGTFETGENLFITTKTISSGQPQQSRKVLRGGTRIEPVLYTQYGQAPNATWNTTMSFEDIVPSSTGATDDYTALYSYSSTFNPTLQVWSKVSLDTTIHGTSVSNNEYTIPLNAVTDGVNLIVQAKYDLLIPGSSGFPIYGRIVKERGGNKVYYPDISGIGQYYAGGSPYIDEGINSFNIPSSEIESGDKIYLEIYSEGSLSLIENPKLTISQYPVYTFPVTSSGANSIWGYADKTNYPYVITSSQSTLVNIYGDNNVKMSNITGSGFNPVTLPWSIKYGDEFRFEDREDFVYQVGKIFGPADSGSGRLFQTGSIEVHFNAPLPVSASTSVFNLDHFVIRRYVDDASQILMEGFAPIDSQGPYIVRPEFVAPELNKSVDQFILDLTQKGLIS